MVNGKVPGKRMTLANAQAATWKAKNYHCDRTPTGFKMTPSSHPKNDRLWNHHVKLRKENIAQDVLEHMLRRKNVQITTAAGAGGHDSPSHSSSSTLGSGSFPSFAEVSHLQGHQSHTMDLENGKANSSTTTTRISPHSASATPTRWTSTDTSTSKHQWPQLCP